MSIARKTTSMPLPACALALVGMTLSAAPIAAGPLPDDQETSKVEIGLQIAPVPLNMTGKNRALVGLGSYLVNAQADCNGCHTRSPQPAARRKSISTAAYRSSVSRQPLSIPQCIWVEVRTSARSIAMV